MLVISKLKSVLILVSLLFTVASHCALADFKSAKEALKSKNYDVAASEFKALSELGYSDATYELATLFEQGRGMAPDSAMALALFKLALDQGHDKAERKIRSLSRSLPDEAQEKSATLASELIAYSGNAALEAALVPFDGGRPAMLTRIAEEPSFKWPEKVQGRYQATVVDLEFDVTAEGYARDFRLVRKSRTPYVEAVLNAVRKRKLKRLAGAYSINSKYIYPVFDTREQYGSARLLRKLKRRAENGSPARKYFYAHAQELAEYYGYQHSERDSNAWYLQAAKGGYAKAQYVVGYRTFHGVTLEQDSEKGWRWLTLAATRGDAQANYFLARSIMLDRSVADATPLFETAAEAGHTTAMLWLARIISDADNAQAISWLEKAKGHLDQVSWHQVAAAVYKSNNRSKSEEFEEKAKLIAKEQGGHFEPLETVPWRNRTAT